VTVAGRRKRARGDGALAYAQAFQAQRADPSPPVPTPLTPRAAKVPVARPPKPTLAQAAEQRLLQAMGDNPGLTVIALANAASAGRSATSERLRQLARREIVEKEAAGRWRLKGEGAEPGPTPPPSS
jgi:hypothetical protein